MMHGRHLTIRKFSCKKGLRRNDFHFSQSLSVISFRYPHAGRTFASILPLAITSLRLEWYFLLPPVWTGGKLL